MKYKLTSPPVLGLTLKSLPDTTVVDSLAKSKPNSKMRRYIIHLKVDYYESQKKDKKSDVEAAKKSNVDAAKKSFALAIEFYTKSQDLIPLKEEYTGPSFTTAMLVEISEKRFDDMIDVLRSLDIVDMLEPDYA